MQVCSQQLELLKPLGSGDDAKVWLARDRVGDATRAFRCPVPAASAREHDSREHIRLLRLLADSGFAGAEDVVCRDGCQPGFTTRFVESRPLKDVAGEFGIPVLAGVLQLLCQSIAYLHSLGFLHGDLKPDNILVEAEAGRAIPRITDLGLAVRLGAQFPTEIRGTHGYMAPEVLEGQTLTEATDIYSFGRILLELADSGALQEVAGSVARLARLCVERSPAKRPQTFWDVEHRLSELVARPRAGANCESFLPPLRHAGVRLRLRLIERAFARDDHQHSRLCLVGGPPGIGKSTLISEFCLERQMEGRQTLRIVGVESGAALNAELGVLIDRAAQLASQVKQAPVEWIFVETAPGCRLADEDLEALCALGIKHRVNIIAEFRDPPVSRCPTNIEIVRIPPLSVRECITSSSHLTDQPTLAIANGEALRAASGGNPHLMCCFLRRWLFCGRHGRPSDPCNFDHVDQTVSAYWRDRFMVLSDESQSVLADACLFHHTFLPGRLTPSADTIANTISQLENLVHSGWLERTDRETEFRAYHFLPRSARNFVRNHMGQPWLRSRAAELLNREERAAQKENSPQEAWELNRLAGTQSDVPVAAILAAGARSPADWKQVVHAALGEYRKRQSEPRDHAPEARQISDGYGQLGRLRRQIRWAGIALDLMTRRSSHATPTLDETRWRCRLLDIAADLNQKEGTLGQLLSSVPAEDEHVRGYLLSELGAIHFMRTDYKRARSVCYEAHHLLERSASKSEEFARNLNRLGLIQLFRGAHDSAQKHLSQCRGIATQHGWEDVRWRCLGNLGMLAKNSGSPLVARNHLKRVRDHYRLARDTQSHLRALSNLAHCYVDLGQGYAAVRSARLAVALAEAISDMDQCGRAHSLLGWVLTMRGDLALAKTSLEVAIGFRKRNGDQIGAARISLTLARLYLAAVDGLRADTECCTAIEVFTREDDLEGCWESSRLRAHAAMVRDDYALAEHHLRQVPFDNPLLSPRDRVETMLAWLALHLWTGDLARAGEMESRLQSNTMVEQVHPLGCEFGRLLGHLALRRCQFDQSLHVLSHTAAKCRASGRVDHLIQTLTIMALLAKEMHNWQIGIRYVKSAELLLERMRRDLK